MKPIYIIKGGIENNYDIYYNVELNLEELLKVKLENNTFNDWIDLNTVLYKDIFLNFSHNIIKVNRSNWSICKSKRQHIRNILVSKLLNVPTSILIESERLSINLKKSYFDSNLLNIKLTNIKENFKKLYFNLRIINKNGYTHGDINPSNIILHEGIFKFVNFQNSVSKEKNERHCKQNNIMFSSYELLETNLNKYPKRDWFNAVIDDFEALLFTFIYTILGYEKRKIYFNMYNLRNVKDSILFKSKYITVIDKTKIDIEDKMCYDLFNTIEDIDISNYFQYIYILLKQFRYQKIDLIKIENFINGKY
jgi:hypothetical protein